MHPRVQGLIKFSKIEPATVANQYGPACVFLQYLDLTPPYQCLDLVRPPTELLRTTQTLLLEIRTNHLEGLTLSALPFVIKEATVPPRLNVHSTTTSLQHQLFRSTITTDHGSNVETHVKPSKSSSKTQSKCLS